MHARFSAGAVNILADAYKSRHDNATNEGTKLATWIRENLKTPANPEGNIDPEAPLHFIGHSAGGFVVGECAWNLQHEDHYPRVFVDLVTTLDTPFVFKKHVESAASEGWFERYRSSFLGHLLQGGTNTHGLWKLRFNNYRAIDTQSRTIVRFTFGAEGHGYAPLWYGESVKANGHQEEVFPNSSSQGFHYSPIINPLYRIDKVSLNSLRAYAGRASMIANEPQNEISGFEVYGDATEDSGTHTLTESSDVLLTKNYLVPLESEYLTFKYKFSTGGDGDFLALYLDDKLVFRVTETSSNSSQWMFAKIPVGEFSGETKKLMIRLASRGSAQAVVQIKELCIEEIADLDGDGVSTMEEYINGTDHRRWDTDGDLISDSDEAPLSDPLLRDSDSDGVDDFLERVAGTDAKDVNSFLKVVSLKTQDISSMNLEWSSVTGKKYRVQWSASPSFLQYETISGIITADGATTSFLDTRLENETKKAGFYRAVVVEAP